MISQKDLVYLKMAEVAGKLGDPTGYGPGVLLLNSEGRVKAHGYDWNQLKETRIHPSIQVLTVTSVDDQHDSTLYLYGNPCQLCARHIVAAGVRKVVWSPAGPLDHKGIKVMADQGLEILEVPQASQQTKGENKLENDTH